MCGFDIFMKLSYFLNSHFSDHLAATIFKLKIIFYPGHEKEYSLNLYHILYDFCCKHLLLNISSQKLPHILFNCLKWYVPKCFPQIFYLIKSDCKKFERAGVQMQFYGAIANAAFSSVWSSCGIITWVYRCEAHAE